MKNSKFESYDQYLDLQKSKVLNSIGSSDSPFKNEYSNGVRIGKPKWSNRLFNMVGAESGVKVLVLGARWGSDIQFLRESGFSNVAGIDLYDPPLSEYVQYGDAHFLSNYFEKNSFDAIWAHHVFEHFFQPSRVIEEIKKIVKDRAFIYIGLPFAGGKNKYDAQEEFNSPAEFVSLMSFYGFLLELDSECYRGKKKNKLYKFYIFRS